MSRKLLSPAGLETGKSANVRTYNFGRSQHFLPLKQHFFPSLQSIDFIERKQLEQKLTFFPFFYRCFRFFFIGKSAFPFPVQRQVLQPGSVQEKKSDFSLYLTF